MSISKMFTTAYTKEINEEERTLIAWGSKAIIDRDREIIRGDAWDLKSYKKHPIILLSHQYQDLWIGKALWVETSNEGLRFEAKFATNRVSQEAFQLVRDTGIAAFSVGFIPKKWEDKIVKNMTDEELEMIKGAGLKGDDKVRIYTKCELLEISLVSVPACPTATLTAYNEGKIKTKELQNKIKETIELEIIDDDEPEDKNVNEIIDEIEDEVAIKEAKESDELFDLEEEKDTITKPEVTADYIHLPAKGEEGKHSGHKIRTIDIDVKQSIKGKYCVDCKKVISFMFDKAKGWDLKKAKKWMADHGKNIIIGAGTTEDSYAVMEAEEKEGNESMLFQQFTKLANGEKEEAKPIENDGFKSPEEEPEEQGKGFSPNEVYKIVKENIELKEKINIIEENSILNNITITKLKDIELKAGAVLNKKNKADLTNAQQLIQNVLDSAEIAEPAEEGKDVDELEIEDDKELEIEEKEAEEPIEEKEETFDISADEIKEIVKQALNEQTNKIAGSLKQEVNDSFRRIAGKVI